jgi:hypothetical protein
MDSFYVIVLSIASLLLIIILTYIGVKMTDKSSNVSVYPPSSQPCPDYWLQSSNAAFPGCVIPPATQANTKPFKSTNTYGMNNNIINFDDPAWATNGKTKLCNQKDWANKYNIQWDGVSNYNNC